MKAMVLFSGGVDSTTCLGMAVDKYGAEEVLALSVSYGQKHQKEVEAARKIAAYYGVAWKQLDLSVIFADSNCSLLSGSTQEIPKETYAEQLQKPTAVGFHLCAVPQRTVPRFCGKHGTVQRLRSHLLRSTQ